MIIKTKDFKESCLQILSAIDSSNVSTITEALELRADGNKLLLNVTNNEYYCRVKFNLDHEETFRACTNAVLFLKLIANITSDEIELTTTNQYINIKGNGNYRLPLIFEDDKLLNVPEINIVNKTLEMNISGTILNSILINNTRELMKGSFAKPVQKMYYLDQGGCITFTTGACVNSFTLEKPVKLLLNQRIVKLFKMFKDSTIKFSLGYDQLTESILQTKIKLETDNIELTTILSSDDSLINSVPVSSIRNMANKDYAHTVVLDRQKLQQVINILALFNANDTRPISIFDFNVNELVIHDQDNSCVEAILYANDMTCDEEYSMQLSVNDFKQMIDVLTGDYVTLKFGDHRAIVLVDNSIKYVIPEVVNVNGN